MSTVGVIVPAFNSAEWLAPTLLSVMRQSFSDWTCVVVDDGSTDATLAVAEALSERERRLQVLTQENRGASAARNVALELLSEVEFVAFLDSDDLWLPDTVERLVGVLRTRPDAVGAYGLAELIDDRGTRISPGAHPAVQRRRRRYSGGPWSGRLLPLSPADDLALAELVVANPFWPPATGMVRRAALEAAGSFDERYPLQEDWELWLRLAELGPFVALDAVTAEYRRHTTNLTGDWSRNYLHQDRLRKAAVRRRTHPDLSRLAVGAWRHELRCGGLAECRRAREAALRRDPRAFRAAAVRALWNLLAACTPGGPIIGEHLVRWRARTSEDGAQSVAGTVPSR